MKRGWWLILLCLVFVYLSGVLIFSGTAMDMSIELSNRTRHRVITINMPDGSSETATFAQLGITRIGDLQTASFLTNPLIWPKSFFTTREYFTDSRLSYNDTNLLNAVQQLGCVTAGNLSPTDAYVVKTEDGSYQIVPDMIGTKVDVYRLKEAIERCLADGSFDVDLLKDDCYVLADVRADDEGLLSLLDKANSFKETVIELDLGAGTSTQIPADVLSAAIDLDNGRFVFDESVIVDYVSDLADTYNTRGKTRVFHTSSGETVELEDVPIEERTVCHLAGWQMNEESLVPLIMNALRSGRNASIVVPWQYRSVAHGEDNDFGDTYLEISIPNQHIWFIENGVCTADAPIVTGTAYDPSRATPIGMYRSTDLYTEHTMTGSYGSAFCHYFIRVTIDGVGVHDSAWRGSYGGTIYLTDGSHGCINTPYDTVDYIFWAIKDRDMYTPIIVW